MKKKLVGASLVVIGALSVLLAAKCGNNGYVTSPIPGVGNEYDVKEFHW